jgi:photosystem II Psb27 protein
MASVVTSLQASPGVESSNPGSMTPKSAQTALKSNVVGNSRNLAAAFLVLAGPLQVVAEEAAVAIKPEAPAKIELGPIPTDFGLRYKDFYEDCLKVVGHMRYAVQMEKGNPRLAEVATNVKTEMLEFVSYYRRFNGIAGKQYFSLLYTSVNVLAGHYTSYGVKFPVPEKRRKRLLQEFNDIEKNVRKKR